jgi:tetratricopeptide (TPR) repeat protein
MREFKNAKSDLDIFLNNDTTNVRAYLNRAGTRFLHDFEGFKKDCKKVLSIDPENINAYFLRGLAYYELGSKEKACDDFAKAIYLGFSILKIAEQYRYNEYW